MATSNTEDEAGTHRVRTMTEKGLCQYEEQFALNSARVENAWKDVLLVFERLHSTDDVESLRQLKVSLNSRIDFYRSTHLDLIDFCKNSRTENSIKQGREQDCLFTIRECNINKEIEFADGKIQELILEKQSVSTVSRHSGTSVDSAKARARAEVARVKLKFAQEEAILKKEQALADKRERDRKIDLELLTKRCDLETAQVEAEVLEAAEQLGQQTFVTSVPEENRLHRVAAFVNPDAADLIEGQLPRPSQVSNQPHGQYSGPTNSTLTELSQFLIKKDLLVSRLAYFDDRAENFLSWKTSFQNIMRELGANVSEELDLLLKYLGPASRKQAAALKAAYSHSPKDALIKIWQRVEERYGAPELVADAIQSKLRSFPKIEPHKMHALYDLSDLVTEIECIQSNPRYKGTFNYYDTSLGVAPIVSKLPRFLQERWITQAADYKFKSSALHPPFSFFAEFVRKTAKIRNDPSFRFDNPVATSIVTEKKQPVGSIAVRKTEFENDGSENTTDAHCPLHNANHPLHRCRAFKAKPLSDRFQLLREHNLCFNCFGTDHSKQNCKISVKCDECSSEKHPTALHVSKRTSEQTGNGGELVHPVSTMNPEAKPFTSACTQVCGGDFNGKSCSKIVLGSISSLSDPDREIKLYALIDDQSNRTVGTPQLFDLFGGGERKTSYTLTTCLGKAQVAGRTVSGLVLKSHDKNTQIELPTVTECAYIPNNRNEIPTKSVAMNYSHLNDLVPEIPDLDREAEIMLLVGRDIPRAHFVLDQKTGPGNAPYAQKLPLGWTIIGESCLGNTHVPDELSVMKTHVLVNGRTTLFDPCPNSFHLQENPNRFEIPKKPTYGPDAFEHDVFVQTKDDELPGLSIDDRSFLQVMDEKFQKDRDGNWSCPLPFRYPRPRLSNNYREVLKRAHTLDKSLKKDSGKRTHFLDFMGKLFDEGHAELAPPLVEGEECWYLPIFPVYHPRKPDQVRVVFDSAAKYGGAALNDVLLSGPDLTNSLLGVLLRFRRESVAVISDIQKMFYCFKVDKEHRNFLRFLWHKDNNFENPLVEFRMCVHIFGNTASPAVATYGLRKTVSESSPEVKEFIHKDFYVDDGLTSLETVVEAVDLVKQTKSDLKKQGNLRLHKIASNKEKVMMAFPPEELAKDIKDLDLGQETLPTQHSLGVAWSLESDDFLFRTLLEKQPFTRRGVLSTVNSIFDPLGFLAPVVIKGKLLLRKMMQGTVDWDEPLPEEDREEWEEWCKSLLDLHSLKIPRVYSEVSFKNCAEKSVQIFSDASEQAIAAVGYLKTSNCGSTSLGFIIGKAKLAPLKGHTIPRLELCAAVLGIEIAETISRHLELPIEEFQFYTDSKVVLGYIHNNSRRFYTYVSNRVLRIRNVTKPEQWNYVSTHHNPADQATRSIPASEISGSMWLKGSELPSKSEDGESQSFSMQDPDMDKEVRPQVIALKSDIGNRCEAHLNTEKFEKFSSWNSLVRGLALLKRVAQVRHKNQNDQLKKCNASDEDGIVHQTENYILTVVQSEAYSEEVNYLRRGKAVPKSSPISKLDPYLDDKGIIRVGGRLGKLKTLGLPSENPVVIPKGHIATLLVRYWHQKTSHQGRHITEGALRANGLWIVGAKRLVSSVLHKCVLCRKLRGPLLQQKMADLPIDRVQASPPFTAVGVDVFGPWEISTRRTRGGSALSKRWAVLFSCLTSRAVHIEILEDMSSSSFINALRRLISIRGPVNILRSDRGTNFVGAADSINADTLNVDEPVLQKHFRENGIVWKFNFPHASHMGGVWERAIGIARKILDGILVTQCRPQLTHEVLATLLAEVMAIMNSRPLVPLDSDASDPFVLSPNVLLTQKQGRTHSISENMGLKDMYRSQWKQVQVLSDMFWSKWRDSYLQSLQTRQKWSCVLPEVKVGDVVLLRDKELCRNNWPMGIVQTTFPSDCDGKVRKVEVRVNRDGKAFTYLRPIAEIAMLLESA